MKKYDETKLNELLEQQKQIQDALNAEYEKRDSVVVIPNLKELVGRYIVYNNCRYSGSVSWDIYGFITGVNPTELSYNAVEVEVDCSGVPKITTRLQYSADGRLSCGWGFSTKSKFDRKMKQVKKLLGI